MIADQEDGLISMKRKMVKGTILMMVIAPTVKIFMLPEQSTQENEL